MTFLSILALGFFLGMRHATDSDHVVAVTTIVSRQREIGSAALTGIFWGIGHSITLLVGDPETVAEKIVRMNESLGGISRLTFQMSVAALPHAKLMHAIELLGTRVAPLVRKALACGIGQAPIPTKSDRAA